MHHLAQAFFSSAHRTTSAEGVDLPSAIALQNDYTRLHPSTGWIGTAERIEMNFTLNLEERESGYQIDPHAICEELCIMQK